MSPNRTHTGIILSQSRWPGSQKFLVALLLHTGTHHKSIFGRITYPGSCLLTALKGRLECMAPCRQLLHFFCYLNTRLGPLRRTQTCLHWGGRPTGASCSLFSWRHSVNPSPAEGSQNSGSWVPLLIGVAATPLLWLLSPAGSHSPHHSWRPPPPPSSV